MTEKSWFWDGFSRGDALLNYYYAEHYADLMMHLFQYDAGEEGVISGYGGELRVVKVGVSALELKPGAALLSGTFYENDSSEFWNYPIATTATRYYRVVLRKDISAQTVRYIVLGPDNTTYPEIIQDSDSIWELPIAKYSVSSGVVGTVVDERVYSNSPIMPIVGWRQGGDSLYWIEPGTTNYSPYYPLMQAGCGASTADGSVSISFPEDFSQQPLIYVTVLDSSMEWSVFTPLSINVGGFTGVIRDQADNSAGALTFYWTAVGPP